MLKGLYLLIVLLLSLAMPANGFIMAQDEPAQNEQSIDEEALEKAYSDLDNYFLDLYQESIGYLIKSEQFLTVPEPERDTWIGEVLKTLTESLMQTSDGVIEAYVVLVNFANELPDPQIIIQLKYIGTREPTAMRFNTNYVRKVPAATPLQKAPPAPKGKPLQRNDTRTIECRMI